MNTMSINTKLLFLTLVLFLFYFDPIVSQEGQKWNGDEETISRPSTVDLSIFIPVRQGNVVSNR